MKKIMSEKGCIGPRGDEGINDYNTRQGDIERSLITLLNLLGVKTGTFCTKNIQDRTNRENTNLEQWIVNICKNSGHVISLKMEGYYITDNGKLYCGWWDRMDPKEVTDIFKRDKCCQWLADNVRGAKFLYILTTFWGCDHTNYYVFEYEDGTFRFTSATDGIT